MKCINELCKNFDLDAEDNHCGAYFIEEMDQCKYKQLKPIKEVCEWDNLPNGESTTKCGNLSVFMDSDFKYCPYCGKPIKIKGE